jgi:peptide/nickel transport system substrate-binding protein
LAAPDTVCAGYAQSRAGTEPLLRQDLAKARQLVKESGYDGRPVVVFNVTGITALSAAALVSRDLLQQIGFNVDLQAVDWSTNLARRAREDPPAQGGVQPDPHLVDGGRRDQSAVHAGISGAGASAWFGWPENGEIERLRPSGCARPIRPGASTSPTRSSGSPSTR